MKKLLLVVCVILVVASITVAAGRSTWIGFDTIVYGWPEYNHMGQMTGVSGIMLIGYGWRSFFSPVRVGRVNFYWEWGLQAAVLGLQGGVGLTFPVEIENITLFLSGSINAAWGLVNLGFGFLDLGWLGKYSMVPYPYPMFGVAIVF